MRKADRQLKKWIDMTERLLNRHPSTNSGDSIEQQALRELFDVKILNKLFLKKIILFFY